MCFLITGLTEEFRSINYSSVRDVKVLKVFKVVLATNKTILMSSNRGTVSLKLINKK